MTQDGVRSGPRKNPEADLACEVTSEPATLHPIEQPRGAHRGGLLLVLLLLLLALAALFRDDLVDVSRELQAWYAS